MPSYVYFDRLCLKAKMGGQFSNVGGGGSL